MAGKGLQRVTKIPVRVQQLLSPASSRSANGQADTVPVRCIARLDWHGIARCLRLSVREVQIIQAIIDEQKDQAIARQLGMSQHTVRTHLDRLFQKLSVHSRTGVIVCVFEQAMRMQRSD